MSHVSVNSWLSRYKLDGISGLFTKPKRGRKPVLNEEEDEAGILEAIKANRQRMRTAKVEWEEKAAKVLVTAHSRLF